MFDYLRNLGKSDDEKRQETLNDYVSGNLASSPRRDFERELNSDPALRAEVEHLQTLKANLRAMPRRRVPRSFSLDAALYGKPAPNRLGQAYPVLRTATAFAALMFIFALGFGLFTSTNFGGSALDQAEQLSMAADEVTESAVMEAEVAESAAAPTFDESIAEEAVAEETVVEETVVEEAVVEEAELVVEEAVEETADEAESIPAGAESVEAVEAEDIFGTADAKIEATAEIKTAPRPSPPTSVEPSPIPSGTQTEPSPFSQISLTQWALIGLGGLFLLLLILTLFARPQR